MLKIFVDFIKNCGTI